MLEAGQGRVDCLEGQAVCEGLSQVVMDAVVVVVVVVSREPVVNIFDPVCGPYMWLSAPSEGVGEGLRKARQRQHSVHAVCQGVHRLRRRLQGRSLESVVVSCSADDHWHHSFLLPVCCCHVPASLLVSWLLANSLQLSLGASLLYFLSQCDGVHWSATHSLSLLRHTEPF